MIALLTSVLLFSFWALVGLAIVSALYSSRDSLRTVLLAPITGAAATLVPVFLLNRTGLPVSSFAWPLTLVWVVFAAALLLWRRPSIGLRSLLPSLAVLLLGLVLIARPMLEFGFDWLSFANPDMANYVLGAHRMVDHGFYTVPNVEDMASGRDYTLFMWSFSLIVRPGSELLLAWAISLTGLSGHQMFMPVIVALHLVLICTAAAMATHQDGSTSRWGVWTVVLLMSTSALGALGTLSQLIAQVFGLSLLAATALLLLRMDRQEGWGAAVRFGLLLALLGSALYIAYPEALPFIGVALIGFYAVAAVRRQAPARGTWIAIAAALPVAALMVGTYIPAGLMFLSIQAAGGIGGGTAGTRIDPAFPFFLVPSGLANLWGLQPLSPLSPEPLLSTTILVGAILCALAIAAVGRQSLRLQPAAAITAVMAVLFVYLFFARSDFGLFKLAMYLQPFLIATVVMWVVSMKMRLAWRMAPLVLLALVNVPTHTFYVERSRGLIEATSAFAEIPNGSSTAINRELVEELERNPVANLISDTSNEVLAKIQAIYLRSRASSFPTKPFFDAFLFARPEEDFSLAIADAGLPETRRHVVQAVTSADTSAVFRMIGSDRTELTSFDGDRARQAVILKAPDASVVVTNAQQNLFNRRRYGSSAAGNYELLPLRSIANHLIFVQSGLGQSYFPPFHRDVSYWKLERDVMVPDVMMSGLGRYMVLQVLNPTDTVRILLSMTSTLKGDGENLLPPAAAVGEQRAAFDVMGRGAARLVSPPLKPQQVDGLSYVGLDLGLDGTRFAVERTGLMRLYGTDVPLDVRRLVGFGRDISAISEEDYARFKPPAAVEHFPADLQHPDLEYSGLYEDGWFSEASWLRLAQGEGATRLTVRGTVPLISDPNFTTELRIFVDGVELGRRRLELGDFELQVAAPVANGIHRVALAFSHAQQLPGGDDRMVGARLSFIGFGQ